jgi:2-iminobutanoate/2-iminopropanoate deaminase
VIAQIDASTDAVRGVLIGVLIEALIEVPVDAREEFDVTERKVIHTDAAPAAVGPYSQAVLSGDLLFSAGQIPLDPATGKLVEGDIQTQTRQVLRNVEAVLAAADMSWKNVVKATLFLADMNDFKAVNEAYATVFDDEPPARSAFVEIEVIARR